MSRPTTRSRTRTQRRRPTSPRATSSTAVTQVLEPRAPGAVPSLAPGVEFMGRMEDSGFEEPPYLVSRPDGTVVQLPAVLYAVAEQIDGSSDYERIAARVTEAVGAG